MTRKALRKRLRTQAKQTSRASIPRSASPWMTVGVLVASAALTTAHSTTASAAEVAFAAEAIPRPPAATGRVPRRVPEFPDPRLSAVHDGSRSPGRRRSRLLALGAFPSPGHPGAASSPLRHPARSSRRRVESLRAGDRRQGHRWRLSRSGRFSRRAWSVSSPFERALEELLEGTSVTFRLTSPNAAVLELRGQAESVDVAGRAPTAIVSSPKYTAPLREIPQTIEVIPRT